MKSDRLLESWCSENLPSDFFKDTSEFLNEYRQITAWVFSKSLHYSQNAINEFLSADEADAFIVAYALGDIATRKIVTQEVSRPEMKSKIKNPEPCQFFKVRYMKTMEMFRELRETF
jgi:hypothetical protein